MKNERSLIKKISILMMLFLLSVSLVACNSNKDPKKETDVVQSTEETKKDEDQIEVHLENPEGVAFDRITLYYGTSSVSPPPDGRSLYNFIKVKPIKGEEYKISAESEGNEVLTFKFEFIEETKENLKMILVKGEDDKFEVKIEDEGTNKLINIKDE